jgi:hypothetical protein
MVGDPFDRMPVLAAFCFQRLESDPRVGIGIELEICVEQRRL